jgi:membrane-associated phospholipid phosphatase
MSYSCSGSLLAHLKSEVSLKLTLLVTLSSAFCVFYFGLQSIVMFPVRHPPEIFLDRIVRFDPRWIWVYQSIYLLMPALPWLATQRAQLVCYTRGFVFLSGVCFAVFLFMPTAGPRPPDMVEHWGYQLLVSYDGEVNVFPSLHIALTVFTLLFGYELMHERLGPRGRRFFVLVAVGWTAMISFATLATKQHWAVDLPAGAIVAWLAHLWAGHIPHGRNHSKGWRGAC